MERASSTCIQRYNQEGYHSIHSHEMMLTANAVGGQSSNPCGSSSFPGFQPMSAQQMGHHAPQQHPVAVATAYSTPQRNPGAYIQQSSWEQPTDSSTHAASTSIQSMGVGSACSNQVVGHAYSQVIPLELLKLQMPAAQPHASGESAARFAEQNLARAAAITRIMSARNSCSSGTSASKPALQDNRAAASPPLSPRSVTIVQGVVGNSLRHLQPWQWSQSGTHQQSLNKSNSSRSPVIKETSPSPGFKDAQLQSTLSSSQQQPSAHQQPAAVTAAWADPAAEIPMSAYTDGDGQGGSLPIGICNPAQANLGGSNYVEPQQLQQQHAADLQGNNSNSSTHPLLQARMNHTPELSSVMTASSCASPAQALTVAPVQQDKGHLPPARHHAASRKSKGGWLACCFCSSAADEENSAPTADAGHATEVVPAGLPNAPRSSEVWGLAKDKPELENQVQAEEPGYIKAYCTEPSAQRPPQQAYDFSAAAVTGPCIGLKAEPFKLDSCSAGGVDSRVSSVGGAAYNPPGAFNPGVQDAAGPFGGPETLRRMSNSRRFSRQGSRMRNRTESMQCQPVQAVCAQPTSSSAAMASTQGHLSAPAAGHLVASKSGDAVDGCQTHGSELSKGECVETRHTTTATPDGGENSRSGMEAMPHATQNTGLWPGLQQQLVAKQNQHQQILKKQLEAETRLIQQQKQLKEQLELLRQIRSRTPSPNGKGLTKASPSAISPKKSIDDALNKLKAAAALSGQARARKLARSPRSVSARQGSTEAEGRAGARTSCDLGVSSVASTAVALGDLIHFCERPYSSCMISGVDGGRQSTSPRSTWNAKPCASTAALGVDCSGTADTAVITRMSSPSKHSAAAGMPFEFVGIDAAALAAAGLMHAGRGCSMSSAMGKGVEALSCVQGKTTKEAGKTAKKPFVLQIPGVNSPPITSTQQTAFTSSTFRSKNASMQQPTAGSFKLPRDLLSLSFKRKQMRTGQQQAQKTMRSWYRSVHLLPKKPILKYSSFKVSAGMLTPEITHQHTPHLSKLVLISPSSGFNSRRIRTKLLKGHGESKDQEVEGPKGDPDGCSVTGAPWRVRSCSSEWSHHSHTGFAETGEFIADAADEETAGTAAGAPVQSPTDRLAHHAKAYDSSRVMRVGPHAAKQPISQQRTDSSHVLNQAVGAAGQSKQHRTLPVSGAAAAARRRGTADQPRRATVDVIAQGSNTVSSSRCPHTQQQGKASRGPSSRQQGSYAAAAAAAASNTRRATTGDVSNRGQQLQTLSRNSYLKLLKEGAGHLHYSSAAAATAAGGGADASSITPAAASLPNMALGEFHILARPVSQPSVLNRDMSPQDHHYHDNRQQWISSAQKQPMPELVGSRPPPSVRHDSSGFCGDPAPAAAGADLTAAREAAARIAALAVRSVTQHLSGTFGAGTPVPVNQLKFGKSEDLTTGHISRHSLPNTSFKQLHVTMPVHSVAGASAVRESLTPTATAARAAAAAAVRAVAAAADSRAAEAKAAADAALLRGGAGVGLALTDELGYGDGIQEFYGGQQQRLTLDGMQSQPEQQQQMLQKLLIEQQMALLQQQLQQLQQQQEFARSTSRK